MGAGQVATNHNQGCLSTTPTLGPATPVTLALALLDMVTLVTLPRCMEGVCTTLGTNLDQCTDPRHTNQHQSTKHVVPMQEVVPMEGVVPMEEGCVGAPMGGGGVVH